jgi:hypothetical protein
VTDSHPPPPSGRPDDVGQPPRPGQSSPRHHTLTHWARLIRAVAWPIVTLTVVVIFHEPMKAGFDTLKTLSVKGAGLELTVAKETALSVLEAADARKTAREAATAPGRSTPPSASERRASSALLNDTALARLAKTQILWVDDNPDNNPLERRAFEGLGAKFTNVKSTATAMEVLSSMDAGSPSSFGIVLSDFSRAGDGCEDAKVTTAEDCKRCEPLNC